MNEITQTSSDNAAPASALAAWGDRLDRHFSVPEEACHAVINEIREILITSTSTQEAQHFASALVAAYPKDKPNKSFVMALAEEIEEFPPSVVKEVIRHLRRTMKWLPAISEVIDVCERRESKLRSLFASAEWELERPLRMAQESREEAELAAKQERERRQEQREQAIRQRRYDRERREEVRTRQRFLKKTAMAWGVFSIGLEFPDFINVIDLLNEYDLADETFKEISKHGEFSSWARWRLLRAEAVRYLLTIRSEPFNSWGWVSKHLTDLLKYDISGTNGLSKMVERELKYYYAHDAAAENEAKGLIKQFLERREIIQRDYSGDAF
jgi:hypothetical protein